MLFNGCALRSGCILINQEAIICILSGSYNTSFVVENKGKFDMNTIIIKLYDFFRRYEEGK